MGFDLTNFRDPQLDADYVSYLVEQQAPAIAGRYGRWWDYFTNPTRPLSGPAAAASGARPYVQAQEAGLPARITGLDRSGGRTRATDLHRKEVVIENDIAWRVQTMVDFLFGRGVSLRSLAVDGELAATIDAVIAALLEVNGGVRFFQEMALLGAVYGFVDVALRTPAGAPRLRRRLGVEGAPARPRGRRGAAHRPGARRGGAHPAHPFRRRLPHSPLLGATLSQASAASGAVPPPVVPGRVAWRGAGGGGGRRDSRARMVAALRGPGAGRRRPERPRAASGGARPERLAPRAVRRGERRRAAGPAAGRAEHAPERPRQPRDLPVVQDVPGQGDRRLPGAARGAGADVGDAQPQRPHRGVRLGHRLAQRGRPHRPGPPGWTRPRP